MKRIVSLAVVALVAALSVAGCATHDARKNHGVPAPTEEKSNTPTTAEVDADVLVEAKKTAVEQLQCTADEVTVSCTRHDVHGGCIAVQARGCGKTLEYDFGNDN
jgi:type IV pilus biogenesis protein CpaD/CtpE